MIQNPYKDNIEQQIIQNHNILNNDKSFHITQNKR